jgi:hypothetical protein
MAEKLTPKLRAHSKKLGIHKIVLKPTLSKLDPEQYEADLLSFAAAVKTQLESSAERGSDSSPGAPKKRNRSAFMLDYLTAMSEKLMHPDQKGEISKMVLTVAAKFFDRGVLFLLKKNQANGLGGFGLADTMKGSLELAQALSIDINQTEAFAEVVHSRKTRRVRDLTPLAICLLQTIGRGRAKEGILVPLLNNGEVLAVLYGDNAVSGRPLGKLRGLELFIAQAGMALENFSLHRKLSLFQTKFLPQKQKAAGG